MSPREIERRKFEQAKARSDRFERRLIASINAKPKTCAHEQTYIAVTASSDGIHGIVIDGATERRCADQFCNELVEVLG